MERKQDIDISPEHVEQIARTVARWIVALESGALTTDDKAYVEEMLPRYQTELALIPTVRRNLDRSYHSRAA